MARCRTESVHRGTDTDTAASRRAGCSRLSVCRPGRRPARVMVVMFHRRALAIDHDNLQISPPINSLTYIDRKRVVEGKSGSVRVDLGGRRIINKKINNKDKKKQRKTQN